MWLESTDGEEDQDPDDFNEMPVCGDEQGEVVVNEVRTTEQELQKEYDRQNQVRKMRKQAEQNETEFLGSLQGEDGEQLIDLVGQKQDTKSGREGVVQRRKTKVTYSDKERTSGQDTDVSEKYVEVTGSEVKCNYVRVTRGHDDSRDEW